MPSQAEDRFWDRLVTHTVLQPARPLADKLRLDRRGAAYDLVNAENRLRSLVCSESIIFQVESLTVNLGHWRQAAQEYLEALDKLDRLNGQCRDLGVQP